MGLNLNKNRRSYLTNQAIEEEVAVTQETTIAETPAEAGNEVPKVDQEKKENSEMNPPANVGLFYPVVDKFPDVTLSTKFHELIDPFKTGTKYNHNGVDIAVPVGTEVYAPCSGKVNIYPEGKGGYGRCVILTGDDYIMIFGHLGSIDVSDNSVVEKGCFLGTTDGGTPIDGEKSTGPHLHFEVKKESGEQIDPLSLYNQTTYNPENDEEFSDPEGVPEWLKLLGYGALSAFVVGIIVGILTESIQAAAYREAQKQDSDHPTWAKVLYTIASIKGLKHIDWHNCYIDSSIPRKAWFKQLKYTDFSRTDFVIGDLNSQGKLVGFAKTKLKDVDFTDVIRLKFSNGMTLFGTSLSRVNRSPSGSGDTFVVVKGLLIMDDSAPAVLGGCEIASDTIRVV